LKKFSTFVSFYLYLPAFHLAIFILTAYCFNFTYIAAGFHILHSCILCAFVCISLACILCAVFFVKLGLCQDGIIFRSTQLKPAWKFVEKWMMMILCAILHALYSEMFIVLCFTRLLSVPCVISNYFCCYSKCVI